MRIATSYDEATALALSQSKAIALRSAHPSCAWR
jgi:hypothetical protein